MLTIHYNADRTIGGYILEGENVMGIHCKNSREVATAIDHYMGGGTSFRGSHYLLSNRNCPICRSIMRRERQGKKVKKVKGVLRPGY